MARGKTNQPLLIVVMHAWLSHPTIAALRAAGHTIVAYGDQTLTDLKPDLILHPAAHGWSAPMFVTETKKDGTVYTPYLDVAVTAARKRKRESQ